MGRLRGLPRRRRAAEGRRVGIGLACYVEGTGVGPYEGGHIRVETDGTRGRLDRSDHPGPRSPDDARADRRRRARRPDGPDQGDDRRHPTVQVRRRHVRLAHRGDVGQRGRADGPQGAGEGAADRRGRAGGVRGRSRDRRRAWSRSRAAPAPRSTSARWRCSPTRCATPSTRRRQRATQFASPADPDKPPLADDDEPGLEGTDYYSPPQSTFANGMHAVVVETDPETADIKILRYCVVHDCGTIINPMIVEGQVHGGVAQGVGGALYERMAYDDVGTAAQRVVHGLPDAVRQRGPDDRDRPPRDAVPAQPARRQGRGGGRRDPRFRRHRRGHRGRRGHSSILAMPISPSELFALRRAHAGDA